MAVYDLMRFFEDVYTKDLSYCAVCLRSEKEVRLSAPLVFRKVLGALKYLDNFKNEKVCYMCEARASAAARFVDMVQLALEIQIAFQRSVLSTGKKREKCARENMATYQSVFAKMRRRSQLKSTQVLQVDVATGNNSTESKGIVQMVKKEEKTIPPEVETVVIDDDNNPQQNSAATDSNINLKQTGANPLNITIGSESYVYFMPVNTVLPNGPVYLVPTTSGNTQPAQPKVESNCKANKDSKSKKKNLISKPPYREIAPKVCSPPVDKKSRKTEVLDDDIKIVTKADDRFKGNEILRQMLTSEVKPPDVKPRRTEVIDDDIEIITEDDDRLRDSDTLRPMLTSEVVKAPIRSDSRVDWEDVIPMELIACAEDKPAPASSLREATNDLLKDLQIVINMGGTIE